jgi:hypothetical protein
MRRGRSEFLVVMLPGSGEERFFIDGASYGSGISVGDLFRGAYRLSGSGPADRVAEPVEVRALALRVEEIHANRRSVETIKGGDIARLYLSGSGTDSIRKGDVLAIDGEQASESAEIPISKQAN